MKLIDRYNQYYNDECAASPWGSICSMEHLQATAIRAALYAFARKYNMKESIPVEDLKNLADRIEAQGNKFIQKSEEKKWDKLKELRQNGELWKEALDELAQDPTQKKPDLL